SQTMRRVLVDYARGRMTLRRRGTAKLAPPDTRAPIADLLDLDMAIDALCGPWLVLETAVAEFVNPLAFTPSSRVSPRAIRARCSQDHADARAHCGSCRESHCEYAPCERC